MAAQPDYDVIVVGAGPAGSAASIALAKKGARVLLIEKGRVPGEKNMSGGVLYGDFPGEWGINSLISNFEAEAPLERRIISHEIVVLGPPGSRNGESRYYRLSKTSVSARIGLVQLGFETGHDYSVLRRPFDSWLAEVAAKAGANLSTKTTVTGLIVEDGAVLGVRTASEDLRAKLVIDASGVASTLVPEAGLRTPLTPRQLYYGIKRVYRLGPEKIDKRFHVKTSDGRALTFLGEFTHGIAGWGFICTNKDTLSVGLVVSMDSLIRGTTERFDEVGRAGDSLDGLEAHPVVAEMLAGAEAIEYSSHNIPRGYKSIVKRPYADGYLVTGDALGSFVKIGPMMDGIRRAISTGMMAAATYFAANSSGSFRAKNLSRYRGFLAPVYDDINRSGRDSFLTESSFTNRTLPRIIFATRVLSTLHKSLASDQGTGESPPQAHVKAGLTGIASDGGSSSIKVDGVLASKSLTKPWVPTCPANCFSISTPKGAFDSFKDLYEQNLASAVAKGKAKSQTIEDIATAKLLFDGLRCVACGTCGAIGPKEMVEFAHEPGGTGVSYRYG